MLITFKKPAHITAIFREWGKDYREVEKLDFPPMEKEMARQFSALCAPLSMSASTVGTTSIDLLDEIELMARIAAKQKHKDIEDEARIVLSWLKQVRADLESSTTQANPSA